MFDTYLTIVGNVLTAPQWRRTTNTNVLVANFKVASTSRRFDRDTNKWIDGNSVRVRVNCWRRLAEGVAASLAIGDPVIVVGRLYTREWTDEHQQRRLMYELEAVAVGHDLSRGRGRFYRTRLTMATSMVEGADAETRVNGEPTERVRDRDAPTSYGSGLPEDSDDFDALAATPYDPLGALGYGSSIEAATEHDGASDGELGSDGPGGAAFRDGAPGEREPDGEEPGGEACGEEPGGEESRGGDGAGGRPQGEDPGAGGREEPVPAFPDGEQRAVPPDSDEAEGTGRRGRRRMRAPVQV